MDPFKSRPTRRGQGSRSRLPRPPGPKVVLVDRQTTNTGAGRGLDRQVLYTLVARMWGVRPYRVEGRVHIPPGPDTSPLDLTSELRVPCGPAGPPPRSKGPRRESPACSVSKEFTHRLGIHEDPLRILVPIRTLVSVTKHTFRMWSFLSLSHPRQSPVTWSEDESDVPLQPSPTPSTVRHWTLVTLAKRSRVRRINPRTRGSTGAPPLVCL